MQKTFLFLSISCFSFLLSNAQITDDDVLLTISGESVSANEFVRVYNKNLNLVQDDSQKEVNSYLELFVNYKLKLTEAKALRYDKDPVYLNEFKSYKDQLTQSYLTDKNVTDDLIREAYDRTENEVKAQHILILLDEVETDTLATYSKIQAYRERFVNEDFESLKKELHNGKSIFVEDLGYFSAFKMVYNFESAAYATEVGGVSQPFRTRFGFHVVKVLEKRKSRGQVTVAHIMIANTQKDSTLVPEERIQELHRLVLQGDDFADLAKQFSDDKSSSMRGGELSPFKSGQINSEIFETTAFELSPSNMISEPIQTQFGWHILKYINKKPVQSFEELQLELNSKIGKDSRSQLVKAKMLEQLLAEYQIENPNSKLANFESNLFFNASQNVWELSKNFDNNQSFLIIKNQTFTHQNFLDYLNKNQKLIKKEWSKAVVVKKQYASFLEQSVFKYKEDNLENENKEFAHILDEYREGLLLFELMQDKIWEGAKNDSIGLQEFYNANKQNYVWPDRIEGSVARSSDEKHIKKVRKYWKKNQSNEMIDEALNKEQQNVIFSNGEFELGHPTLPKTLEFKTGLSKVIEENSNFYVVNVTALKPTTQKTFEEAQGQLIADYQIALESEWIQELRTKFKVDINEDVLAKVNVLISK
ncbi:peptidylprolyl isomerase [Formosa sp. Hel1_33_131]|uniref:peptidylprolyl isomerase n=1 Tax=Formosa sp. Hel1_33_131 TaxID=1336794 RepID=UPI00084E353D|nr:peptidylprolyl isomerase [Formosa sp. Hel1_33_131]